MRESYPTDYLLLNKINNKQVDLLVSELVASLIVLENAWL